MLKLSDSENAFERFRDKGWTTAIFGLPHIRSLLFTLTSFGGTNTPASIFVCLLFGAVLISESRKKHMTNC